MTAERYRLPGTAADRPGGTRTARDRHAAKVANAQILVALCTSAALEFAIALRRHQVIMWPASALLTGNGVAFILRVPGTEHGDWWSLRGWWIFAGAAALSLLS